VAELTLVRPELMSHDSAIRVRDHSNAEIYRTRHLGPGTPLYSRYHNVRAADWTFIRQHHQLHPSSPRRVQFACKPTDRICLHWIHSERRRLGTFAGRAFERALLESGLAGRDARQCHPVFAYRTHRPFVDTRSHPLPPKNTHLPQLPQFNFRNDKW
jgi:hypothetical protein